MMKGRGSHTEEGSEITKEQSWVMLQLAGRWRRGKKEWGEETSNWASFVFWSTY